MENILLIKSGCIKAEDIELLRSKGYIIIEAKNTKDIQSLTSFDLEPNIVLKCALEALAYDSNCRFEFGQLIRKRVLDKISKSSI